MTKAAALETIRRYNAGEITERQACDWFDIDRLTFRTAIAQGVRVGDEAELRTALEGLIDAMEQDHLRLNGYCGWSDAEHRAVTVARAALAAQPAPTEQP